MREIVMPKSSMTMTEGELTKWLRSDGEEVSEGDAVAEILTDKVEMEVEAPSSGTLGVLVDEGATVAVGTPIAVVLNEGEEKPRSDAAASARSPGEDASPAGGRLGVGVEAEAGEAPAAAPARGGDGRLRASPAARAMARRIGVDLARVRGSGPRGRVKSDDVASFAERGERAPGPDGAGPVVRSRERPHGVRGAMARHVSVAASIPQFTLFVDVAMAAADAARRDLQGISLTDVIVRAVGLALREHPAINAHFTDGEIVQFESVNVGLAVDTPGGLVVPVIKGADGDLGSIAAQRVELAEAARIGRLRPEEVEGGTFTVSNLGMYGVDVFQPVLDPPRVGILSVGRLRGDAGRTATLGLACDHRAVDGAQGARFLQTLTTFLERPDRYLV